jgi:hypothetical protein
MGKITRLMLRLLGVWRPGIVFCSSGNAGDLCVRQSTRLARSSPFGGMVLTGGGTSFGEHRINRYISDSDHNYFGYDLLFDSAGPGAIYRLAFEPLSVEPGQFLRVQATPGQLYRDSHTSLLNQFRIDKRPTDN